MNSTLPCGFCSGAATGGGTESRLLTQTLVGGVPGGPGPGSVLVEGVTSLAVVSRRVMLAGADQAPLFALDALAGVTVALTPEEKTQRDSSVKDASKAQLFLYTLISASHHKFRRTYAHREWSRRQRGGEIEKVIPP